MLGSFFVTVVFVTVLFALLSPIWIQKDACGPHNHALQFGTLGIARNVLFVILLANFQWFFNPCPLLAGF